MKKFNWRQLISQVLPLAAIALVYLMVLVGLRQHSQSWYFQDETEHLTNGWMMWRYEKDLYTDLSSNHQPLPILAGAAITKLVPYNTLYILVERVRLIMFGYLCLWAIFLTWRFRWRGWWAATFTGLTSYWFFGWYVLAESLAIPLVIFNLLLLLETVLPPPGYLLPHPRRKKFDLIIFGLSAGALTLTLSPLWPFILISSLIMAYQSHKSERLILAGTYLGTLAGVFYLVSPWAWYQETVRNVFLYVLQDGRAQSWSESFVGLTYPFQSLAHPSSTLGQFFLLQLIMVGINLAALLKKKLVSQKSWLIWLALLLLVLSLNSRVYKFPQMFYTGFHLYPFIGAWLALVAHFSWWSHQLLKNHRLILIHLGLTLSLIFITGPWIFEKKDKANEHFIQYGDFQTAANLILILKQPGDTLITGPDGAGYVNLLADIPFAGKQLFHLPWAWRSPELRAAHQQMLDRQPPTFVIFSQWDNNGFSQAMEKMLAEDYQFLYRLDGSKTPIQVRVDRLRNLSTDQQRRLFDLYFATPAATLATPSNQIQR